MKKYRFSDPRNRSIFQKLRPYVFIFVGWNAVAILSWKYINHKAGENDEGWSSRSSAERIVALTGSNPRSVKVNKVSLLGGGSETSVEDNS